MVYTRRTSPGGTKKNRAAGRAENGYNGATFKAAHIQCYCCAQKSIAAERQARLRPSLGFELRPYLLDTPAARGVPSADEPKNGFSIDQGFAEYRDFHYLIQILECVVTLHCQVAAESAADARLQVERIPNLIKWREISVEELAELT